MTVKEDIGLVTNFKRDKCSRAGADETNIRPPLYLIIRMR